MNDNQSRNRRAVNVLLGMYVGEQCRVCGARLTWHDVNNGAVFAGYSNDNKSRAAHCSCWNLNKPQPEWAFPHDAKGIPE